MRVRYFDRESRRERKDNKGEDARGQEFGNNATNQWKDINFFSAI